MKISSKQYAISLYEAVKNKKSSQLKDEINNFIKILINYNDISKIDKIIEEFKRAWNKEQGIVEAEIVSARKLDSPIIKLLNSYVAKLSGAKKVEIKQNVDKNLLGGVMIKYEDKVMDGSMRMRLNNLKAIMIK